jgi:hypothetical protein
VCFWKRLKQVLWCFPLAGVSMTSYLWCFGKLDATIYCRPYLFGKNVEERGFCEVRSRRLREKYLYTLLAIQHPSHISDASEIQGCRTIWRSNLVPPNGLHICSYSFPQHLFQRVGNILELHGDYQACFRNATRKCLFWKTAERLHTCGIAW